MRPWRAVPRWTKDVIFYKAAQYVWMLIPAPIKLDFLDRRAPVFSSYIPTK